MLGFPCLASVIVGPPCPPPLSGILFPPRPSTASLSVMLAPLVSHCGSRFRLAGTSLSCGALSAGKAFKVGHALPLPLVTGAGGGWGLLPCLQGNPGLRLPSHPSATSLGISLSLS